MSRPPLLIRDALVVTNHRDRPVPFRGWVRVEGSRIAAVGEGEPDRSGEERIVDGRERALLPGLVNAHAHSHSSLTRGSAEGKRLEEWIAAIEREQSRLDPEQAYWGALATYAEALLSGTTAILDMCLRPEAALRAAEEIGIRARIAPYAADSKPFAPTLGDTAALIGPDPGARVGVWVGLHDLESASDDQVRAGAALAAERGVGLHLHCAETRASVEATRRRTGATPVAHLEALGALGPRTVLAHCVWADGDDRARLAAAGAHVVHCPHANAKLGSGIAPVPDLDAAGIGVALGTDGAKANNRLDPFDVMKFASLLHKAAAADPTVLPPGRVLDMAAAGGARALGLGAGAIAPAEPADLVLVRLDRFHLQPAEPDTVVTNLVHAARGSDVDGVVVDGEVVVSGGRLATADEDRILARAAEIGRSLM